MNDLDNANARDSLRELGYALDRLQEALSRDVRTDSMVLDATIQRFEFCVELTWKTLKKLLEAEGENAKTPKQALQKAYAAEWIHDEKLWISMLLDRNLTSHTYKESLARDIHARIPGYCQAMRQLYATLVLRFGEPG
ncbi:MAG: nucleotidyltransferase substrate binding protein [Magnetococcales bacterium]|nr:nucleotidyltransferase substrate binding protein [Magnetococcales bacterium]